MTTIVATPAGAARPAPAFAAASRASAAVAMLACASVALVVLQVFAAGIGVFEGSFTLHRIVPLVLGAVLVAGLVAMRPARTPRGIVRDQVVLIGLFLVQGLIIHLVTVAPIVTSLHPVNAMLIFMAGVSIARRTVAVARDPR